MWSALLACAVSAAAAATPMQSLSDRWSAALASWSNAQLLEAHARSSETPRVPGTPSRSVLATELAARAGDLAFSDDDWRLALRLADAIHTRPKWPAGEPLVVWIRLLPWLGQSRTRVRAVDPDLGEVSASGLGSGDCAHGMLALLDAERERRLRPLPAGTHSVLCEVTIEVQDALPVAVLDRRRSVLCLWSGSFRLEVEAVDGIDAAMEPAASAELDAQVRRAFWMREFTKYRRDGTFVELGAAFDATRCEALRGVAVSADVELRHFGRTVARAGFASRVRHGWGELDPDLSSDQVELVGFPVELLDRAANVSGWTLFARGSGAGALPAWEADRWWCGELEIPLAELVARGVRD